MSGRRRLQPGTASNETGKVTDRLTPQDREIYDQIPFVGRLMVHRDRKDADIMRYAMEIQTLRRRPEEPDECDLTPDVFF